MIYSTDHHEQTAIASGISKIMLRLFPDADVETVSKLETFAKEAIDLHAYETSKTNRQAIKRTLASFQKEHQHEIESLEVKFELVDDEESDYCIFISYNEKTNLEMLSCDMIQWFRPGGEVKFRSMALSEEDPTKSGGAKKSLLLYGSAENSPE